MQPATGNTVMRLLEIKSADVIAALVLVGLGLGAVVFKLTDDARALEARIVVLEAVQDRQPDIVFTDYSRVGELLALGAAPAELEPILQGMGDQEQRLIEAGYVVLNTSALVGGPGRFIVPAPGVEALEARLHRGRSDGLGGVGGLSEEDPDLNALGLRLFEALDPAGDEGGS